MLVIFLPLFQTEAAETATPLRKAVDIYNSLGSTGRMLALMKIGASEPDRRYIVEVHSRQKPAPLPNAYLAGQVVYFKSAPYPLEVLDLRKGVFAIHGRKFDLSFKNGLRGKLSALGQLVGEDSAASLLMVAGLAANTQCLELNEPDCIHRFLGLVTALGDLGGLKGKYPVEEVFCIPGRFGQPRFVVSAKRGAHLAIAREHNQLWLEMGSRRHDVSENKSARELVATCRSREQIESLNVAFSYEPDGAR